MIVVDTSALIAILGQEPDAALLVDCALSADSLVISAGTALELAIVAQAKWRRDGSDRADAILAELGVAVHPVSETQLRLGAEAYRRYGRASGSPARLNFGDCFAYALARALDAPLLFKGDDFVHTDLTPAFGAP